MQSRTLQDGYLICWSMENKLLKALVTFAGGRLSLLRAL